MLSLCQVLCCKCVAECDWRVWYGLAYLKEAKADKLPQQLCSCCWLQMPRQATQLLQELHQIMPAFCLQKECYCYMHTAFAVCRKYTAH